MPGDSSLSSNESQSSWSSGFAASGQYQLYELSKLILRRCENQVISPGHYESFSSRQRQAIEEYFRKNTGEHEFNAENPEIFLFGAVCNDAPSTNSPYAPHL